MDKAVAAYIKAIPIEHCPLFDRVAGLIASVAPKATTRISYGIPTYEVGKKRLYLGVWKHGVSLYGWSAGGDGGFLERHPDLQKGKGTIQLTASSAAKLSDAELKRLVRATLS